MPWSACSPAYAIADEKRFIEIQQAGAEIGLEIQPLDLESIENAFGTLVLIELDELADRESYEIANALLERRKTKPHQYFISPFWSCDSEAERQACPNGAAFEEACLAENCQVADPFTEWSRPSQAIVGIVETARSSLRRQGLKPVFSSLFSFVETPLRFSSLVTAVHAGNLLLINDMATGVWRWLLILAYGLIFIRRHWKFLRASVWQASPAGRRVLLFQSAGIAGAFPASVVLFRAVLDIEWRIAVAAAVLAFSGQWLLMFVSRPRQTKMKLLPTATTLSFAAMGYSAYVVSSDVSVGAAITICILSLCLYFAVCHIAEELNRYVLGLNFFSRGRQYADSAKTHSQDPNDDLGMLCRSDETPEEYYYRITRSRREQGWSPPANDSHAGNIFISHRNDGSTGQKASEVLYRELQQLPRVVPFLDYLGVDANVRWRHDIGEALSQTGIFVSILTPSERDYWLEKELECALWMRVIYGTPEILVLEIGRELKSLPLSPRLDDVIRTVPRIQATPKNVESVIEHQVIPYVRHRYAIRESPVRLRGIGQRLEVLGRGLYAFLCIGFPLAIAYLTWRCLLADRSQSVSGIEVLSLFTIAAVSGYARIPQVLDWLSASGKRSVYTDRFPTRQHRGLRVISLLWTLGMWSWIVFISIAYLRADVDGWTAAGTLAIGLVVNTLSSHLLNSKWPMLYRKWRELPETVQVQTDVDESTGTAQASTKSIRTPLRYLDGARMVEKETVLNTTNFEYSAFISYKHAVDSSFAADFEVHMKRYAKSRVAIPRKLFRDEQHLRPGDDLSESIRGALQQSEYFILLSSPEAAGSPWVCDELEIWCQDLERVDRLIVVLTAGTIGIQADGKTIDWDNTNALPDTLQQYLTIFPLWVDLSKYVTRESRTLDDPTYKASINAIVARLDGTDPNALLGEEWRIRRRSLQIAWSAIALLTLLFVVSLITSIQLAASLRTSKSRELAATARLEPIPTALTLAAEAVRSEQTNEAVRALIEVMGRCRALRAHVARSDDAVENLVVAPDLNRVVLPDGEGKIRIINLRDGNNDTVSLEGAGRISSLVTKNNSVYALGEDGVWKLTWPAITAERVFASDSDRNNALTVDEMTGEFIIGCTNGEIWRHHAQTGESNLEVSLDGVVNQLISNQDWIVAAVSSSSHPVSLYSVSEKTWKDLSGAPSTANAINLSPSGDRIAAAFEMGQIGIWSIPAMELKWMKRLEFSASSISFSPDGEFLAAGDSAGNCTVFDANGNADDTFPAVTGGLWCIQWNKSEVVTAGSDGWIRRWQPLLPGPFAKQPGRASQMYFQENRLIGLHEKGGWRQSESAQEDFNYNFGEISAVSTGTALCIVDSSLTAHVPDEAGGYRPVSFPDAPETHKPDSLAINSDGSCVAAAWRPLDWINHQSRVSVWDLSSGTVRWMNEVPRAVKTLAFDRSERLAAIDDQSLTIWSLKSGETVAGTPKAMNLGPTTAMAFLDSEKLLLGGLMGFLELRSVSELDKVLARSELPVGSIRDLEILADGSLLSVDIDGVRWFDTDLSFRGAVLDTSGQQLSAWEVAGSNDARVAAILMQGGSVITMTLDPLEWAAEAERRAGPQK